MILSLQDIEHILKNRPNKPLVDAVQAYSRKLTMHITGAGLDTYIQKLDYFEKKELYDIRLRYTRSNKDFFSRLHRPIDKIFTANGGSSYYNMPDGSRRAFLQLLGDVEWGHSLRSWVKTFWQPALHYDPMGLIMMEVDAKGDTYPTYKSSNTIYDYQLIGRRPEYVVLCTDIKTGDTNNADGKPRKIYRVVDDAMDYLVEWNGNTAVIIEEHSFTNHYGKLAAWVLSDRFDPQRGYYISPDDAVIELADQYLREGGILNVFKNHFGFPQRWRYMGDCDKCKGTTQINGEACDACNGSGRKHKYDVSQDINLPIPSKEDPLLVPPAGNIEASVTSWDKMDGSLDALFNMAYYTKWGVEYAIQTSGPDIKTATQSLMDEQPKIEALYAYSAAAEQTEKLIADHMGSFYFGSSYGGADINYGKRFMLESPDKIMDSLVALVRDEAPYEIVREKMEAYYHTLYQGDSVKLNTALKLIDVEPLPFCPLSRAKELLNPMDYARKLYYNDWRGLKTTRDMLMKSTVEALRASLTAYTLQRISDPTVQTNTQPITTII